MLRKELFDVFFVAGDVRGQILELASQHLYGETTSRNDGAIFGEW